MWSDCSCFTFHALRNLLVSSSSKYWSLTCLHHTLLPPPIHILGYGPKMPKWYRHFIPVNNRDANAFSMYWYKARKCHRWVRWKGIPSHSSMFNEAEWCKLAVDEILMWKFPVLLLFQLNSIYFSLNFLNNSFIELRLCRNFNYFKVAEANKLAAVSSACIWIVLTDPTTRLLSIFIVI